MEFKNYAIISYMSGLDKKTINSNEVVTIMLKDLMVEKLQSMQVVNHGNTQTYTINIKNDNNAIITNVTFNDTIPVGMTYIVGSFKVDNVVTVPVIVGQLLSYVIPNINNASIKKITFQCTVN